MNKHNLETSHYSIEQYIKMAVSFSFAKLGMLIVKHPLSMVAINKQAYPHIPNFELMKDIYHQNGIWGFYRSTPISILKILVSESYRGPLMMSVPMYVETHLHSIHADNKVAKTLITIGLISAIDSTLTCPLLRLVTHRLTLREDKSMQAIVGNYFKVNPLKEFYRGHTALFIQTMNLWGIFFIADDATKFLIKKYCGSMSYTALTICSSMIGIFQASINVIPDTIRIQMQKADNHALSLRQTFQHIIKNHGRLALINTLPHRFFSHWIGFLYKSMLREYWTNRDGSYPADKPHKNEKKGAAMTLFSEKTPSNYQLNTVAIDSSDTQKHLKK